MMDNLTHTLVGLALAESGLKRTTRLATAALIVGANLPDVDGLVYLFGSGTDGLAFRRGWTHGVLAMILLPPLLVAVLLGWHRLRGKSRDGLRVGWLVTLAAVAIWSHPLLDLLNTYGVRLLMPFSGRWFYGDALFIVDPWLWVTLLLGILLARRARGPSSAGRPAQAALLVASVYALLMAAGSRIAERRLDREAPAPAQRSLASPVPGNPLRRETVRQLDGGYERGRLRLIPWEFLPLGTSPSGADLAGAAAAARTAPGAAFLAWARFPYYRTVSVGDSLDVTIADARYGGGGNRSWASVTVRVAAADRR
ncbi:MAG TPA: metal-dependent hydrolase [Gemmatimonadales bacterium]|jgi:inner membrane protein